MRRDYNKQIQNMLTSKFICILWPINLRHQSIFTQTLCVYVISWKKFNVFFYFRFVYKTMSNNAIICVGWLVCLCAFFSHSSNELRFTITKQLNCILGEDFFSSLTFAPLHREMNFFFLKVCSCMFLKFTILVNFCYAR